MWLRYLIVFGHKMQDPVKALSQECFLHTLGTASQVELYLDTVAFLEPARCLASLELEVMVASTHLDLDRLGFSSFCATFGLLGLFLHFVLVLAVLHDLANRRFCHRADLDEVQSSFFGNSKRVRKRHHAEVTSFGINDTDLCRTDLFVDSLLQDKYSATVMSRNNTKEIINSQSFRGIYPIEKKRGETLAILLDRFRGEHGLDWSTKLTYAGRLDPMAEGIVLVLAGEDRFVKDRLLGLDKVYEVEILLGISTDTQDPLGVITETLYKDVSGIEQVIENMKMITALPYPMYSSVPVDGKPLFAHARAGTTIEIPQKKVTIYSAELLEIKKEFVTTLVQSVLEDVARVVGDFRQEQIIQSWQKLLNETSEVTIVKMRVHASSGTYMRSLAAWIGEKLGVPALAYRINRIQIGEYSLSIKQHNKPPKSA